MAHSTQQQFKKSTNKVLQIKKKESESRQEESDESLALSET